MLPLPAPSSQNLSSSEAFKSVVGAVKASGAASFNNANGLPEKQAHWKFRLPTPHSADAVEMLVRQMGGLSSPLKLTLSRIAPEHAVILNVQPAAKCPQLGLTWDSLTHGRAAAFGSPSLLRWLLGPPNLPLQKPGSPKTAGWFGWPPTLMWRMSSAPVPTPDSYKAVKPGCPNARLLLLVHGHGWTLPATEQRRRIIAEESRFAFYDAVCQLRSQASADTTLGNLPDPIIKMIACKADIDFSWTFST